LYNLGNLRKRTFDDWWTRSMHVHNTRSGNLLLLSRTEYLSLIQMIRVSCPFFVASFFFGQLGLCRI
jgi:hypothetical protein